MCIAYVSIMNCIDYAMVGYHMDGVVHALSTLSLVSTWKVWFIHVVKN